MSEQTLEDQQREHAYRVRARKAVESRRHTDRPGARWHLSEVGTPQINGVYRKAAIFPSPDGYDVYAYTYEGAEVAHKRVKGLDTAFRHGERFVDEEQVS